MYTPLAKIVAMHDINTNNKNHIGVKQFWNELKNDKTVEFKYSDKTDE
jgi:hypothetical protein